MDYLNWGTSQPDNVGGAENSVHMESPSRFPNGAWNDLADSGVLCGVVEVPGKSNPKSLSEKERALVGTWYVSGKMDHSCHITATENQLFGINDNFASRLTYTTDGQLFSGTWHVFGEISGDKILWSNGTWWSRKPAKFEAAEKRDGIKD